jgi:hypothetical protein
MIKNIKLVAFLPLIASLSTACMEKSWLERTVSHFAQSTLSAHTYDYGSFKHIATLACLFVLPNQMGQNILTQQRNNMKVFLKNNEANALEEIRKHYNIDPEIWKKSMEQAKADQEFNLAAMRRMDVNYDTYHDPDLPQEWIAAIKNECKRHDININSFNLTFNQDARDACIASCETKCKKDNTIYSPATINLSKLNYQKYNYNPTVIAYHEITHAIQAHHISNIYIHTVAVTTSDYKQLKMQKETLKILEKSIEYTSYRAAQEKTADTLIPCDDPKAAKLRLKDNFYPNNLNDIAVLDANWKTSQAIKLSRQIYRSALNNSKKIITDIIKTTL